MINSLISSFKKSDKYFSIPLIATILVALIISLVFIYLYPSLPSTLPLFYSLPWGSSQLINKDQFFILPAFLILVCLINSFIAYHLHEAQIVLKRVVMTSLIFIDLLIIITALKILSIFC